MFVWYYLIRDIFLYIIAPIFLFDFLSKYGFQKYLFMPFFTRICSIYYVFNSPFNKILKLNIKNSFFRRFCCSYIGCIWCSGALKEVLVENNDVYKTAFYIIFSCFPHVIYWISHKLISQKYQKIAFISALLDFFILWIPLFLTSLVKNGLEQLPQ